MALALPGKVQIAGVIDQDDADLIIECGADMLGFPLGLKDGREDLGIEEAAAIVRRTEHQAASVCITYHDTAADVLDLCDALGVRWVQLHGPIDIREVESLKKTEPGLGIIKSLIVRADGTGRLASEVRTFETVVDSFITDTFDPDTGRTGATGKTHDWAVSRMLVEATHLPVILAGGLTPDNVADAIAAVAPAAVDAHTGVESPNGRKSPQHVRRFVDSALAALE